MLNERDFGHIKSLFVSERTSQFKTVIFNGIMKKEPRISVYNYLKGPSSVLKMMLRANLLNKSKIVTRDGRILSDQDKKVLFIQINIDFICFVLDRWSTNFPGEYREYVLSYIEPVQKGLLSSRDLMHYLKIQINDEPYPLNAQVKNHWFATQAKRKGLAIQPIKVYQNKSLI